MKKIFIFTLVLLFFACNLTPNKEKQTSLLKSKNTNNRYPEFKVYPNGLIYSEYTMNKLNHIVDSLNLKFKSCDVNKRFYSEYQTVAYAVILEKGNLKQAKKDMENQIPIQEFIKKYPKAKIEKEALVIMDKYLNYKNEELISFSNIDFGNNNYVKIESEDKNIDYKKLQNKWLFKYNKKPDVFEESIESFYFPNKFTSTELPQKYAQMIGYSTCLIDTTTSRLFKENLKRSWAEDFPDNWTSLSKAERLKLLDKMVNTVIRSGCGQDPGPRDHALKIALLSAETASWKIFLKAHLDIMTDKFYRNSDNSKNQEIRKTYIRELEVLNINLTDLLFGISFRVSNPAKNNYYGSIYRIGRAIAETNNRNETEQGMLSIIADKNLDDYNRVLFYSLFLNYNENIKDEKIYNDNYWKLLFAKEKLPNYIKYSLTY